MATRTTEHLLQQAAGLLALYPGRKPRQTELRRAISAAYYGVFHFVLEQAADTYVGAKHAATPQYGLAYRSISDAWLRNLCTDVAKPNPPAKLKPFLPENGLSEDLRKFAVAVAELQEKRHGADYAPADRFGRGDELAAIERARSAVERFANAPASERQVFLSLLLFQPRA